MNEKFEKYIENLSPELQEKARECKTKEELNAFLADNEIELPEDALEMVSGGCSCGDAYEKGAPMPYRCPECSNWLRYWDTTFKESDRMYCDNPSCSSYNNGLWFKAASGKINKCK